MVKKRRNLQTLKTLFTNSTKIKFVNFVDNYSYKVNNIEYEQFCACVVKTVLFLKIMTKEDENHCEGIPYDVSKAAAAATNVSITV